jgi:hypothetical protein
MCGTPVAILAQVPFWFVVLALISFVSPVFELAFGFIRLPLTVQPDSFRRLHLGGLSLDQLRSLSWSGALAPQFGSSTTFGQDVVGPYSYGDRFVRHLLRRRDLGWLASTSSSHHDQRPHGAFRGDRSRVNDYAPHHCHDRSDDLPDSGGRDPDQW